MGSIRLTLCTGLLVGAAAFGPPAHAADGDPVTVTPADPAPGAEVTLRVSGCTGRQASAASPAFVSDARLTGGPSALTGDTRVSSTAQPGSYDVKVACADRVLTGHIRVLDQAAARSGASRPPASPVAPVAAGGGGTAHFATVATSASGPDTGQAVTGLALAGGAALAVGLRARRGRRSH
ncbi:hypothetical protein [Streptomyces sp. NPDC127190]|uniref:hypothetical protein n=1 Tax=unclassified Streptomyces TaxID=2593676 RepID=UPI003626C1A8